jgi:hypothetical protein
VHGLVLRGLVSSDTLPTSALSRDEEMADNVTWGVTAEGLDAQIGSSERSELGSCGRVPDGRSLIAGCLGLAAGRGLSRPSGGCYRVLTSLSEAGASQRRGIAASTDRRRVRDGPSIGQASTKLSVVPFEIG